MERLIYKGKSCLGATKISQFINELGKHGYITIIRGNKRKGERDLYKLNITKSDNLTSFIMSYFAVLGVIKENITPEDFKIFCFIKYRIQNESNCTELIIADELGISRQNVSFHVCNLVREKYLEVTTSGSTAYFYSNRYKANC